jgi:hypothetical protein
VIAIRVLLDGETLATVGTEGLDLVTVQVHGDTTQAEFAVLEMSGGIYPADGESTYLIWLNSLELRPGQAIGPGACMRATPAPRFPGVWGTIPPRAAFPAARIR